MFFFGKTTALLYAVTMTFPFLLFLHSRATQSTKPSSDMPKKRPREPPIPFNTLFRSYRRCCSAWTTCKRDSFC